MKRLVWFFLVVPSVALAQPTPTTQNPGRATRIGVGNIGPAGLPADLRIRLEDSAAAGLAAAGATVTSATELARSRVSAGLGACTDPVCERRLAKIMDTRYWLRGFCLVDVSTYRLHLELVDADSGSVVAARDDTCDICTEADVGETASMAASALKATLPGAQGPTAAAPPALAITAPPPRDDARDAETVATRKPLWLKVLPWVAFAGAAAAIAGGAYYVAINGEEVDCAEGVCRNVNDTIWRDAVPRFGLGVALATAGVVLLTVPGRSASGHRAATTQVIVSSDRISVRGSF